MKAQDSDKAGRIRHLNDLLRCQGIGGQVMITAGLDALGDKKVRDVVRQVAAFTAFDEDNDPHGERDCATLSVDGIEILWKIDYFDLNLEQHSPNAADSAVTARVLTIMLAGEY